MPQKHQIHKLYQIFSSPKTLKSNPSLSKSLPIPLTTPHSADSPDSPESPDLPTWLHSNKKPEFPDGDFVIPSLADWVEHHNLGDIKEVGNHLLFHAQVSDIDRVSEILKKHYPCTDSVVQALNDCGVNPTNNLISQLLNRFCNDWVPALGLFTWAKHQTGYVHPPDLYDLMVDILGRRKKFSFMWELVKEMENLEGYVSLVTMKKVMRRLARAGNFQDAVEAFRGIEKLGVRKDIEALNVLMDALVKEGSVEHAYSAFMEFKDSIHVDFQSFNILLHGYCKARKLDDARKIMDEMDKQGFQPNVVSYTCFIELYCKLKDFRNVEAIFSEMQEKSCKPNVITYTIFMHALGKAKQVNKALEVYEMMKSNCCVPDASFYSSLIFVLTQSGRLKDAWDVFEDMKKQGVSPDLLTYNTMITSACTHLEEENALKLLRRMEEDSCKPDIQTYAPLLKMCCRKKRIKVLKFLLNHMFKNNISIDLGTYVLLVGGLCKSGKLELACSFFEEMVMKGLIPRDRTYKMLVEELEQNNLTEAKEKIQKLMFQTEDQTAI
ncbi:pentatricopeptide repeat-containing protein At3g22670, mitochondrial [Ricinus communis]|uniref:Pentatricopeptide repeat-containing protein, putative n=1 Tax=Ricinus communis TaxID=3988 RepID=B9RTM5_RICCO|nr:pentatricopeptide repeat-containing protein At3g22670, mitochondrial [Ricinus communis]EEF45257.1 pentatricopeptide repeat-containing protein, putative [Ricinus communis]|eukprot:XP_002517094.1 pentatricopeptide repeat-containing protein At3g22670, mitochondrial [Ricinus communis]